MQDLQGLTVTDFEKASHIVIAKVEVEKDWSGNFEILPDVEDFNISSTISNIVQRLCSVSFSITCLNTYDRYALRDPGASHYEWIKQGRRIRIFAGIRENGSEYYWKWITGRIDKPKFNEEAGKEICTITGRDFMRMLDENDIKQEWWGKQYRFDTVEAKEEYAMPSDCKGVFRAWLDIDAKDGSNLLEITEGSDWTYDWDNNKFIFLRSSIPPCDGLDNLVIFYYQSQVVENALADILIDSGVLLLVDRKNWLENANLITPTGKNIDRIWFNKGTSCLEAVRLLDEVVGYRFYLDFDGNPIFKPKPTETSPVKMVSVNDVEIIDQDENIDEVYNHVLVKGEKREKISKILTVITKETIGGGANAFTVCGLIEDVGSGNATKKGAELGVDGKQEADYFWEESGSYGIGSFYHQWADLVSGREYWTRVWAYGPDGKIFGRWASHTTD